MACENCKYWKPSYAAYAHRFVMECTNEDKNGESGGCKHFERKPKTDKNTSDIFRYNDCKN